MWRWQYSALAAFSQWPLCSMNTSSERSSSSPYSPSPVLDRAEHSAAVGQQRVVVLQGEQQLEGAEVGVGGDHLSRSLPFCRRIASSAQRASWKLRRSECVGAYAAGCSRAPRPPSGR